MAMAALSQSSPALAVSMDVPHTQNTAPVLEFRCLFTPDLRRKQKRWQDGRLKFHTFNKRVMVYDDRSNFVGDTHWRKDYQFDDGEELQLERGGILVEVGECVGKRDQDLTELVDKRVKEREERVAAKNAASPMRPQASLSGPHIPAGSALLKPKSLNAVLGNPTGHYGKAVAPIQSPFEQRQQAIRDGNENERPAKRRKQDKTPPSKNGYAQNLMGTKLTLASSKPPSTATIRYEPLRPSIQRTPAATIDLTRDEDDHRIAENARSTISREERSAPKLNRQRPNKSTSMRSGYASSLTGASLSLNRPEGYSSKRAVGGVDVSTKRFKTYQTQETGSSSSVGDSLVEDESSEERPANRTSKEKEPTKKRTKNSMPASEFPSRSSSPPVTSWPTSISNSATIAGKKSARDSPANRLLADQPVSTLRIKSRAPRKMMMLMERPMSRSPAPTQSSKHSHTGSKRRQNPKPGQNVVLSQATMRLDVFREQQEKRLQKRLNGERLETDFEEVFSSSADSGINHQMIDNFLSHKTKPAVSAVRVEMPRPKDTANSDRVREDDGAAQARKPKTPVHSMGEVIIRDITTLTPSKRSPPQSNTTNCADSEVQAEGPPVRPGIPKVLPQPTIPSSNATDDTVPSQSKPAIQRPGSDGAIPDNDLDQPSELVRDSDNLPNPNNLEENASSHESESSQSRKSSSEPGTLERTSKNTLKSLPPLASNLKEEVTKAASLDKPLNAGVDRNTATLPVSEKRPSVPVNAVAARPNVTSLSTHMNRAIMSATAHSRTMIKSSASPPYQAIQDLSPAQLEQPILPRDLVPESQSPEPAPSDVAIKASPRPSPTMVAILGSVAQPTENVDYTTGMDNTSNSVLPIVPKARIDQPKAKLVNPATRGLSVQMTANRTVNALVPAFIGLPSMAPPPPRISSRPGRIPAQDEALATRSVRGRVKEVTPGGPWSRESFDLFGSWRPPGRDTGTHAVNG